MGGMWKLAAMSVVIGAGLVVAWQAQQGLKATTPTAGVLNRSEADALAENDDPDVKLGFADPEGVKTPAETAPIELDLFPKKDQVAVAASVPPEQTNAGEPTLRPDAARYRRGINFRENTTPDPIEMPGDDANNNTGAQPRRLSALKDPSESKTAAKTEDFDFGPTLLKPSPETGKSTIQTVAAEVPAAEPDPFADSAPPPVKSTEPRLPTLPLELDEKPEPAPLPVLGAPAEEPFPADDAKPAGTRPGRLQQAPAETNDPDPFATEPPPGRLPSDLDTPANKTSPTAPTESAPVESEPFDPFAPAKVPTPAVPPRVPAEPLPTLDTPPARTEPSERTPLNREVPRERRVTPASESMIGDGTAPPETPRGVQEPRLTIEKTAPPKALLGQPLVYSILVKNVGNSPTNQVQIEDRIPRGTRLVGTSPRAEMQEKRLMWKLGTLQPNEERRISIKVIPEEEGTIGSVAKVSFVTEIAADIVVSAPQLKLRVNGPSELRMQETSEFVFTLSNPGDTEAKNVILRSLIPDGLSHPAGNDLEYKIEKLAAGESREVRLELTGTKVGRVTHHSIASADGNLTTEAKTNIEIVGEQIVLTRSSPPKMYVGRQVTVSNKVGNEGQRPVNRVRVTEIIPVGFEFVEASDGGIFDSSTRTITWNVGPLAVGGEQSLSATLNPKSAGQYESVISATGPTGSVATVKPKSSIEGFPSLALEPLGDQRLVATGERLTSRLQIKNNGSATAENVGLVVELPPELKLVSVKAPSAYQVTGQRLQFEPIGQLPARTGATFELVLEAVAAGDVRLELQISADHLKRPVRHEEAVQVFEK